MITGNAPPAVDCGMLAELLAFASASIAEPPAAAGTVLGGASLGAGSALALTLDVGAGASGLLGALPPESSLR